MQSTRQVNRPNGTWSQRVEHPGTQFSQASQGVSRCVEERPFVSLLAVFGFGVVAGASIVSLYYGNCAQETSSQESFRRRVSDAIRDAMPNSFLHSRN